MKTQVSKNARIQEFKTQEFIATYQPLQQVIENENYIIPTII